VFSDQLIDGRGRATLFASPRKNQR
jgi:hypothetical protein